MRYFVIALIAALSLPFSAQAGEDHRAHGGTIKHKKVYCTHLCKTPTEGYKHAAHTMHRAMDITYTGNADVDFAKGMIPHHQGAIDMANVVLKFGKDPEIRALAERIIAAQKLEIARMQHWLYAKGHTTTRWWTGGRECAPTDAARAAPSTAGYEQAVHAMHQHMNMTYSRNADVDFARGMIPHHQGAIDMAWVLKKHGREPWLQTMADDVIRSQSQEIRQMEEWLKVHGK